MSTDYVSCPICNCSFKIGCYTNHAFSRDLIIITSYSEHAKTKPAILVIWLLILLREMIRPVIVLNTVSFASCGFREFLSVLFQEFRLYDFSPRDNCSTVPALDEVSNNCLPSLAFFRRMESFRLTMEPTFCVGSQIIY